MRFEINPKAPGSDELLCDVRQEELRPELDTAAKVAQALAAQGGEIATGLVAVLREPQPQAARTVRMLTIRVLKTEVVSEISIAVPEGEAVWIH